MRFHLGASNASSVRWVGLLNSQWRPPARPADTPWIRGFTPPRTAHSQAYFWAKEWQDAEAEVQRELDEGRGLTFGSAQEAIDWLDSDDDA
jgi:hypothetical protein